MIPVSDSAAPSLDRSILARLRRLDPQLVVTWHPYSIDPFVGGTLLTRWGAPVPDPSWYLWRRDDNSSHHFLVAIYKDFGHEQVRKLEADVFRYMSPEEVSRAIRENQSRIHDQKRAAKEQLQRDKIKANAGPIHDLVFGNRPTRRDAKVMSYGGQRNRGSRGQVDIDPREAGWELPEAPSDER